MGTLEGPAGQVQRPGTGLPGRRRFYGHDKRAHPQRAISFSAQEYFEFLQAMPPIFDLSHRLADV